MTPLTRVELMTPVHSTARPVASQPTGLTGSDVPTTKFQTATAAEVSRTNSALLKATLRGDLRCQANAARPPTSRARSSRSGRTKYSPSTSGISIIENANASPPSRRWTTYLWARKNPIVTATNHGTDAGVSLSPRAGPPRSRG